MEGDNGNGYAQIGYVQRRFPDGTKELDYFWQWTRTDGSKATNFWGPASFGTTHQFTVDYWSSDTHIHMRIDGDPSPCNSETTLCGVTGYDPYNHWFTPFWGAWMSEVDNSGDDFAGVSDTPEKLTVVQERFGSSWTSEAFRTSDGHPADGWNWRWKGDLGSVGSRSVCWADQQDQNNTSAWNSWTQPTDHSCS